jgi:hypothetical protein
MGKNILSGYEYFLKGVTSTYMLSGCELIDPKNISLPSQNMKFVGEGVKRTSHKLHISISMEVFFFRNKLHGKKYIIWI